MKVKNDLNEALAHPAVTVDLTNNFEEINSVRIHVLYNEQELLSCIIHILKGWQSDSYLKRLYPTSSL